MNKRGTIRWSAVVVNIQQIYIISGMVRHLLLHVETRPFEDTFNGEVGRPSVTTSAATVLSHGVDAILMHTSIHNLVEPQRSFCISTIARHATFIEIRRPESHLRKQVSTTTARKTATLIGKITIIDAPREGCVGSNQKKV